MCPSVPYNERLHPKHSRGENRNTFSRKVTDNEGVKIIKPGSTERHHLYVVDGLKLYLGRQQGDLMSLGEKKFQWLKVAVMQYNTMYSNNSELEDDLYIHEYDTKEKLKTAVREYNVQAN